MDLGLPVSYLALEKGTPVYTSDGERLGRVAEVLAAEDQDLFEGIVISEHPVLGGHRFVDADQIADMHTEGVVLKLDSTAAAGLPEPTAKGAVMRDDSAGGPTDGDKLKRGWYRILDRITDVIRGR